MRSPYKTRRTNSVFSQLRYPPHAFNMSSAELANQLVFASVGPFVTSLWLAGDWGLTSAFFLIGHYLIRLPIFGQDTNLGWAVFNNLDSFWNFTMIGFLIIGAAAAGTIARLVLKIPNVTNIRKLVYGQGDRNQHKFIVPNNGTAFFMLFLAILAIGGTLVFHDIFIPEDQIPLLAVIATPFIVAALYLVTYFIMMFGCDNREGTAIWGYDRTDDELRLRAEQIPGPNWSVMRRTLFAVASHHILVMVAVDLSIIFTRDFLITFIVAAAAIGVLLLFDIILYAFYLRTLDDYAPYYNDWVQDLINGSLKNDDRNLNGLDDDNEEENYYMSSKAVPMSRLARPAISKKPRVSTEIPTMKVKRSMFSSASRL